MTIDEVYSVAKYRANKFGYNISPADFNLMWPQAERTYFNKEYAMYAVSQKISDTLSKFMQTLPLVIDSTGKVDLPADLIHIDSITHNLNGVPVEVKRIEKDRLANNLSSSYDMPNTEFPIYTQYATYLQFYPVNLVSADMVYLFQPAPSKWAYTLTNNRPVYDDVNSTNPLWLDADINNIIYLLLQDVGVNLRDQELETFSQNQEKTKL